MQLSVNGLHSVAMSHYVLHMLPFMCVAQMPTRCTMTSARPILHHDLCRLLRRWVGGRSGKFQPIVTVQAERQRSLSAVDPRDEAIVPNLMLLKEGKDLQPRMKPE